MSPSEALLAVIAAERELRHWSPGSRVYLSRQFLLKEACEAFDEAIYAAARRAQLALREGQGNRSGITSHPSSHKPSE